jgi:hypothetical protein
MLRRETFEWMIQLRVSYGASMLTSFLLSGSSLFFSENECFGELHPIGSLSVECLTTLLGCRPFWCPEAPSSSRRNESRRATSGYFYLYPLLILSPGCSLQKSQPVECVPGSQSECPTRQSVNPSRVSLSDSRSYRKSAGVGRRPSAVLTGRDNCPITSPRL